MGQMLAMTDVGRLRGSQGRLSEEMRKCMPEEGVLDSVPLTEAQTQLPVLSPRDIQHRGRCSLEHQGESPPECVNMSDFHTDWITSQLAHAAENLTQEIQKVPPCSLKEAERKPLLPPWFN